MRDIENELIKIGYKNIAGLDEVGRGAWAGPLVVAICILPNDYNNENIKDSKKINEKRRKIVFEQILKNALLVDWIIYKPCFIDKNNPKKTSIIGMEYLVNKHKKLIDYCLIDAEKINSKIMNKSIIKGDEKSISIAAASIVAKVVRDEILIKLDKKYPNYFFAKNKGYGTKKHLNSLIKYGPIDGVHRFSYKPISKLVNGR